MHNALILMALLLPAFSCLAEKQCLDETISGFVDAIKTSKNTNPNSKEDTYTYEVKLRIENESNSKIVNTYTEWLIASPNFYNTIAASFYSSYPLQITCQIKNTITEVIIEQTKPLMHEPK